MGSARDMAGLGASGQGVPNYNIYGHQHVREPFKDKRHLLTEEIYHPRWLEPPPAIRSRGELQQARKRGRVPNNSYDFDGDGVVGQLDYFIGRSFDKDNDGRLTPGERSQAKKALTNGFLDKYVRGIDSQGDANRPYALKQVRGVILSADNPSDVSNLTYQRHHNAHHVPAHSTKTSLEMSRLAEAKGLGTALGEKYISENAYVQEPRPHNHESHPRTCPVAHIRERAEADHQLSRVRGGLLPMNGPVNPERELKNVGLGYDPEPFCKTRGQLLETRREAMKRHGEELRAKGEELCVPLSVRRAEKEAREYEFRRSSCEGEPRTATQMKDDRRRDKIEYDLANFGNMKVAPREYPRFSDRPDIPFWVGNPASEGHLSVSAPLRAMAPSISEPCLKVTEQEFGHDLRESRCDFPDAAFSAAAGLEAATRGGIKPSERFGSNTVKRFTAEEIDRGAGRNKPRLFDSIQPVTVGPMDLQSLELTSSMEPIRMRAMHERREQQRQNALNPRRSRLWYDSEQAQQMSQLPSQSQQGGAAEGGQTRSGGGGGRSRANTERVMQSAVSEPALRATAAMPEREPRFYGNSVTAPKPSQNGGATTGVRCGGFQRLDWPPRESGLRPQRRERSNTTKSEGRAPHPAPAALPL